MKYAIEDSFPIVEINRLAVPERNAFKPIYQMHKWFARRASCVFRAILLGCMKPIPLDENGKPLKSGAEVIMEEFYRDHTYDPDTNEKVVLDPFMGGGTTVVEALRLGCKVIGIDLSPVAWFIVKTEIEPVDVDELKASFQHLAKRKVSWSGKSLEETLLEQYKTECPCCGAGREEADIVYTFWVKSAICTNCKREVPLFSDYVIAAKTPSIRYSRDVECPECRKSFDWELESGSLLAEAGLCINAPSSAGVGRTNVRWAFSATDKVECPWCKKAVRARIKHKRKERKKVPLTVLLCPNCYSVWQWRGNLPDRVSCPVCNKDYEPNTGNIPKRGWYVCQPCGHTDRIINSIRSLPEERLLPMRPYAIEGYCSNCAGNKEGGVHSVQMTIEGNSSKLKTRNSKTLDHMCTITKNNGKFFKKLTPSDVARYQRTCEIWEKERIYLPYPKQKIPDGQETHRLLEHHYQYWHQMFNPRQLLCLSTLLKATDEEGNQTLKEMVLSGFYMCLEANNMFARYRAESGGRSPFGGIFSRHDFQPKLTPCEINVYGPYAYYGTFIACMGKVFRGKEFNINPFDYKASLGGRKAVGSTEKINGSETMRNINLYAMSSSKLNDIGRIDFLITDPPYASNVNYSELADFFYVWLRLTLLNTYREFTPELTPKIEEIIENPNRGKTAEDFEKGLTEVLKECNEVLEDSGLLAFTFHHAEGSAWEALLKSVCNAGFILESVYPIHGEAESSLHLMDKESIAYDLIHVCRKQTTEHDIDKRSWAGIRQEIRRRAREEIQAIEIGRYGNTPLPPADINIILIGKCLELYSRHYGAIIDHEGNEVPLKRALEEIRMMVDQLQTKEQPLPSELSDIDPVSYLYLTCLCDRKEIKSDDVHKATRGIMEPEELIKAGLMIRGRTGRGRTYEVKQPSERFDSLTDKFKVGPIETTLFGDVEGPVISKAKVYFIDYIHFLMAFVEGGENIVPWLERFRGETPRLRAACEYLAGRNKNYAPTLKKILDLIDVGPLFKAR